MGKNEAQEKSRKVRILGKAKMKEGLRHAVTLDVINRMERFYEALLSYSGQWADAEKLANILKQASVASIETPFTGDVGRHLEAMIGPGNNDVILEVEDILRRHSAQVRKTVLALRESA